MIDLARQHLKIVLGLAAVLTMASGCFQGRPSAKPPIHPNPNMDSQPKYKAQSENEFYSSEAQMADASMRPLVEGTVPRGWLQQDTAGPVELTYSPGPLPEDQVHAYFTGRPAPGSDTFVEETPVPISRAVLERGQQRYDIYCGICHGGTGDGRGAVTQRGVGRSMVQPPAFTTDRIMNMPDGQIYNIITNGGSVMPSYRVQIPVEDRWAIISYVRALQRSQMADRDDVPPEQLQRLKASGGSD